ncbi:MAG: hypothetical protein ACREYA_19685, partial [Cupriavidus necator]
AALLCTGLVDASLANAAYQRSDAHWWGYKVTIIAMRGRWYGQCRWLCKSAQIWWQREVVGLNVRSACSKAAAHLSGAVVTKKGS